MSGGLQCAELRLSGQIAEAVAAPYTDRILEIQQVATVLALEELHGWVTSIGKESSAKIRLKGFFAPKFAAFVNRSREGYFISPASGKELRVNGDVVSGKYRLQDGDIIQVAGIKMNFNLKE